MNSHLPDIETLWCFFFRFFEGFCVYEWGSVFLLNEFGRWSHGTNFHWEPIENHSELICSKNDVGKWKFSRKPFDSKCRSFFFTFQEINKFPRVLSLVKFFRFIWLEPITGILPSGNLYRSTMNIIFFRGGCPVSHFFCRKVVENGLSFWVKTFFFGRRWVRSILGILY